MSLKGLLDKLERRGRLEGFLLVSAIILILCSFLQTFPLAVYPYRLLLLSAGIALLSLDLYLVMADEKMLIKHGITPVKIPKKRKVLRPSEILSTGLRASLYATFVICLFIIGLFYPSFAWASWLALPPIIAIFCGYLIDNFRKVVIIILVGYLLAVAVMLALYVMPFWEAYKSCFVSTLECFYFSPANEEETLGGIFLITTSFLSFQVPLGFFGALIGANIKNRW
jgi:hypothetical protein